MKAKDTRNIRGCFLLQRNLKKRGETVEKKKTTGRPPKYKSKEEMQDKIDQYFKECEGELLKDKDGEFVFDKNGFPIIVGKKPLTMTGLALALGFSSRQSLLIYKAKKESSCRKQKSVQLPFLIQLIHIRVLQAETQCLRMAVKINIHMSIRSAQIFHRIHITINQELCPKGNSCHRNSPSR